VYFTITNNVKNQDLLSFFVIINLIQK